MTFRGGKNETYVRPLSLWEEFRARRKRIRFDTKVGIQGLFFEFCAMGKELKSTKRGIQGQAY